MYLRLFFILFLFVVFIVFHEILPCPRARLKLQPLPVLNMWQPYTKPSYLHMDINKPTHFPPFFFLQAWAYAHPSPPLTPPPLLRCFYNQLDSKSISHIPHSPFDIQIDLFTRYPANKRNSLTQSLMWGFQVRISSMPMSPYLKLGLRGRGKKPSAVSGGFLFLYNSIKLSWDEERTGGRVTAEGTTRSGVPCQADLSPPSGKERRRGENGKRVSWEMGVEMIVGGASRCWEPRVSQQHVWVCVVVNWCRIYSWFLPSDVWFYALWLDLTVVACNWAGFLCRKTKADIFGRIH